MSNSLRLPREISILLFSIAVITLTSCAKRSPDSIPTQMPFGSTIMPMQTPESINTEHLVERTMDNSDQIRLLEAIDVNPTYKSTSWTNVSTGARYTTVPTTNLISVKGKDKCRRYRVTAIINGLKGHMHGVACKEKDGWKMVT